MGGFCNRGNQSHERFTEDAFWKLWEQKVDAGGLASTSVPFTH